MDIKLSNMIRSIKDFAVDNDERTLFDWLVYMQRAFGSHKPFRHSIAQVTKATKLSRHLQNRFFKHFVELGFLTVGREEYNLIEYRSFFVSYTVLAEGMALANLINANTETYREYQEMFVEWAKEQTTGEKPLSKRKQKEKEREAEELAERVASLMKLLDNRYDKERERFNNGELTNGIKPARGKSATGLVFRTKDKRLLGLASQRYTDRQLDNAMIAYSHAILKDNKNPAKIMSYFMMLDDEGEFAVINHYLDEFNTIFSFKNE